MTIVITKGDNPGNYIYVDVNGWFRYSSTITMMIGSIPWVVSDCTTHVYVSRMMIGSIPWVVSDYINMGSTITNSSCNRNKTE
jgi:hypothetical protein